MVGVDIDALCALYTGHARLRRLVFVAKTAGANKDEPLELEALRAAYKEAVATEQIAAYREIASMINGRLGAEFACNDAWIDQVEKQTAQKQDKLEAELNGYKANLIKESIRMGHSFLGEFFYEKGDLDAALKCYIRTRDYCTTGKHVVTMCMNVIKVGIELENYMHVLNYVQKAEQTPDSQDGDIPNKLRSAAGLAHLSSKKFKMAARKFLAVSADLDTTYSEVIAPQDVAIYGALCALATFDRAEIKTKIIDSVSFRNLLELVPEVREAVNDFYTSKYASCLLALESLKGDLQYDIHLHTHVGALCHQIREKALIQYTIPFTTVILDSMSKGGSTKHATQAHHITSHHITPARPPTHTHTRLRECGLTRRPSFPHLPLPFTLSFPFTHTTHLSHSYSPRHPPPFSFDISFVCARSAFNTDVVSLERELASLIGAKQISARIDSHNKILYSCQANQRNMTYKHIMKVGEEYQHESRALLLRANLLQHRFVQKRAP